MYRPLVCLAFLLAVQFGLSVSSAAAGEFYFIDQTGDGQILLLDPSTIVSAHGGKTAHVAFVSGTMLWNDIEMEFDCAGKRYRKLSAVSHPMMIRSKGGVWQGVKGSIEAKMTNVVCRWPAKTMESVSAPDFQTLIKRASGIVDQQQREKKR